MLYLSRLVERQLSSPSGLPGGVLPQGRGARVGRPGGEPRYRSRRGGRRARASHPEVGVGWNSAPSLAEAAILQPHNRRPPAKLHRHFPSLGTAGKLDPVAGKNPDSGSLRRIIASQTPPLTSSGSKMNPRMAASQKLPEGGRRYAPRTEGPEDEASRSGLKLRSLLQGLVRVPVLAERGPWVGGLLVPVGGGGGRVRDPGVPCVLQPDACYHHLQGCSWQPYFWLSSLGPAGSMQGSLAMADSGEWLGGGGCPVLRSECCRPGAEPVWTADCGRAPGRSDG
ncbi:uncharacterized protein LOC116539208 [Sapajus apella]|uniref:Uncharacterized protein LOC116539208 n=1 Tax=Sapajus apella TaxID=9515 RepID=A0A6J3GIK5_SAPAP|nr:uncharacterized protein LOC116539208 [Sapajus apella]